MPSQRIVAQMRAYAIEQDNHKIRCEILWKISHEQTRSMPTSIIYSLVTQKIK